VSKLPVLPWDVMRNVLSRIEADCVDGGEEAAA